MAFGKDEKGKFSIMIYVIGIVFSFINEVVSLALFAAVAMMWFIPDRRIENTLAKEEVFPPVD